LGNVKKWLIFFEFLLDFKESADLRDFNAATEKAAYAHGRPTIRFSRHKRVGPIQRASHHLAENGIEQYDQLLLK
jgi:hypothetical protein